MNLFLLPLKPKRGVIYGLLTLAEASWLATVLLVLVPVAGSTGAWFESVVLAVGVAILFGWLTDVYQMPLETTRAAGMVLAGAVWLALLKATLYPAAHLWQLGWLGQFARDAVARGEVRMTAIWLLAAVGYIWWRCLFLGHTPPEMSIAKFTMEAGGIGFAVALLLGSLQPALAPSLGILLLFVVSILLAMSLSHTQTIAEFHGDAATGRWGIRLLNSAAIVGGALIAMLVLGSLFSLPLLDKVMSVVGLGLAYILKPLLAFLIWLMMKLEPLIQSLIRWLQSFANDAGDIGLSATPAPASTPVPAVVPSSTPHEPVWWAKYTIWMWRAAGVTLILWLFYRFTGGLRQRYRRGGTDSGGIATVSETISPGRIGADGWFTRGKKRLADVVNLIRQFGIGGDLRAAATIRRIYAALTVLAAQHGHQRAESQTPLEFLGVLKAEWTALAEPLTIITNAYINVHYGQLPEGDAGLARVRSAWDEVYAALTQPENGST